MMESGTVRFAMYQMSAERSAAVVSRCHQERRVVRSCVERVVPQESEPLLELGRDQIHVHSAP
jgi:hypothetical protein